MCCKKDCPAFSPGKRGKVQTDPADVQKTTKKANLWILVEQVIQQIKCLKIDIKRLNLYAKATTNDRGGRECSQTRDAATQSKFFCAHFFIFYFLFIYFFFETQFLLLCIS